VLDGHGHEVVEFVHAGRIEAHDGGVSQLLKHGFHHSPAYFHDCHAIHRTGHMVGKVTIVTLFRTCSREQYLCLLPITLNQHSLENL
jgi:hypothetical protein